MKNTTTTLKVLGSILKSNFLNILFVIIAIIFVCFGKTGYSNIPKVIFFDIGQGDSILIQQDSFQILIDGGPGDSIIFELPKYMPWYDKEIEIVVLTHPHEDHIAGLMHVLEEYKVKKVLYNPIEYDNSAYKYMLENYEDILQPVKRGDLFEYKDLHMEIIYPFETYDYQENNINNESIVALLRVDDYKLLFMGDSEQEIEERLLLDKDLEDIFVLKVGHHCSRTSTNEMFLTHTDPDIAICSVGRNNKFNHPHYETIEKLQKNNVQYLITYEEGNILFRF
ncbi:MAG: ComEC/Rec2 family competence protein [Candidatus Dojkabacteria bacterium]